MSLFQSILLQVGDDNGGSSSSSCAESHCQTDRASTADDNRLAKVRLGSNDGVVCDRKWLDQGSSGVRHGIGNPVRREVSGNYLMAS